MGKFAAGPDAAARRRTCSAPVAEPVRHEAPRSAASWWACADWQPVKTMSIDSEILNMESQHTCVMALGGQLP